MTTTSSVLTWSVIAKEYLYQLLNNFTMANLVNRQYAKDYSGPHRTGATITIPKPNRFRASDTEAIAYSDITEPSTTITISHNAQVTWDFLGSTLRTSIDNYSERFIKPAVKAMVQQIDRNLLAQYVNVYNSVGSPGTDPASFAVLAAAAQRLDEECAPQERFGVFNPAATYGLANGMVFGTYYSGIAGTDKIVGEWITKGNLGEVCGINCYKSQNVNRHTTGHFTTGATPLIDSTTATGASTLKVDGFTTTTNTVKKGDIFTLGTAGGSSATAPLYATNPMSGDSNSYLRQFAVGGDLTSTGSGDMVAVAISPKCQYAATDPFTTVSQLPIDEHNLTFLGTQDTAYAQNLVFCKDAFGLVCLDHERPDEGVGWIETDPDSGLSIRIWKVWDWATNRHICRCDCLYGVATFYPELAVRVWGK